MLERFREAEELRIATAVSMNGLVPPPPPQPLPPPAHEPTDEDEKVYDEDSVTLCSVHSEYADDLNSVDDDMSTVVPDLEARDSANRNPYRTYLHRQF